MLVRQWDNENGNPTKQKTDEYVLVLFVQPQLPVRSSPCVFLLHDWRVYVWFKCFRHLEMSAEMLMRQRELFAREPQRNHTVTTTRTCRSNEHMRRDICSTVALLSSY
jgi:hypothetical protein